MLQRTKSQTVDMTEGNSFRHILFFSLPLLAGNVFQQLYNAVDTWVVGNYVSNEAFSAVGSVSPIINMLIGAFMGFASGAGVVISQYYGAREEEKVKATVHTAISLTILLTIGFTILGLTMTPTMLRWMKTPPEVYPQSYTYLTIYFAGMVGLLFYNMGAGILRAVGDSKRPFYFLVVAALLNTGLDLLFVLKFHMGVEGVAYATIIAQAVSALLTYRILLQTDSCVKLSLRNLRIDWDIAKKIFHIGIPAALQLAVTSFSNVFVQSYINQFGADCMSGWTAYLKLDQILFLPMQSIGLAATTFVGQNLGRQQIDRAKSGVRVAVSMAVTVTLLFSAIIVIFAPYLVRFFNPKAEVIVYGTMFLHWLTPFYVLCSLNQVHSAALRGAGNTKAPMVIMLTSFVLFRQIYLYIVSHYISNTVLPLAMGYPAGWLVCSLLTLLYYRRVNWERYCVVSGISEATEKPLSPK